MQKQQIQLHEDYLNPPGLPDSEFIHSLALRRQQLLTLICEQIDQRKLQDEMFQEDIGWSMRSYPVLAVLAPALETNEGKIEYPGDPMCLYSALCVAIDEVVKVRMEDLSQMSVNSAGSEYRYNDLCPQWGTRPSLDYRQKIHDSGVRDYTSPQLNTDQTIFDPRVWNEETKQYFVKNVLPLVQPKVVLISSVSPAHRYAIDIARHVRQYLPNALIVFGGRHMDETMHFQDKEKHLSLANSSTLSAIADGRIEPVVDFIVSGDGYFALDLLMKAISLAMSIEKRTIKVTDVVQKLIKLSSLVGSLPGRAVIAAIDGPLVHVFPLRGPSFDLAQLPSPYQSTGIRARFSIFETENGSVARTAHMMITSSCPFHCNFCSESMAVTGAIHRFSHNPISAAIDRVLEYVSYGAQAIFFDDSIFWSGNIRRMVEFCQELSRTKAEVSICVSSQLRWLQYPQDHERLVKLQWGAQLTADFMTTMYPRSRILECLKTMKAAGCTYIYVGIESMAVEIMQKVHKNIPRSHELSWAEKIRQALIIAQEAGIRVGSSVLFGLDGETHETIEITIEGVGQLIDEGLLYLASPNILTYHPDTPITRLHGKENQLDYHSLDIIHRPPYLYFEEAFPGVVSKELSEDDIWYIHQKTKARWGNGRYMTPLPPMPMPSN